MTHSKAVTPTVLMPQTMHLQQPNFELWLELTFSAYDTSGSGVAAAEHDLCCAIAAQYQLPLE